MGLISGLLTLPLAPVRGVVWLGGQLEREARRQWSDPAAVRQQLAELDVAFAAGEITETERDERQDELVARLLSAQASAQSGGLTLGDAHSGGAR
jgi:Gas vesicle protein G